MSIEPNFEWVPVPARSRRPVIVLSALAFLASVIADQFGVALILLTFAFMLSVFPGLVQDRAEAREARLKRRRVAVARRAEAAFGARPVEAVGPTAGTLGRVDRVRATLCGILAAVALVGVGSHHYALAVGTLIAAVLVAPAAWLPQGGSGEGYTSTETFGG